ncbi:MAG: hypothetical protein R6V15_14755, partial [Desulfotignum sp.]
VIYFFSSFSFHGLFFPIVALSWNLNICYSSMRFYGEPLVVSCERTVSVGGGLVKNAGMVFNQRMGCRTSLFACKPAPADLGPGTGHHQGRALGQPAAQSDRKPGMLMANIQMEYPLLYPCVLCNNMVRTIWNL